MGRFPFPQNQRLPGLIYPTQASHGDARRAYLRFKEEIVTSVGARGFLRTRRPDTPDGVVDSTVSEGIAYGMLIAVAMDDQDLFDALWRYALCFLNQAGLMSWYIAPDGQSVLGFAMQCQQPGKFFCRFGGKHDQTNSAFKENA